MRKILISLPEELLLEINEGAKEKYMSRTEYIRFILLKEVEGRYQEAAKKEESKEPWRFADLDDS